jgi:hypothetical protein
MKKDFTFSLITLSFVLTTIIVFLSEWIQETGLINFPLGFRHLLIIGLFSVNWFLFGNRIKIQNRYRNGIIIIGLYLFAAYFISIAPLFNYILGIFFTFLFVFLFIIASNTSTRKEVIIGIFNYLLLSFFLMSIFSILQGIITRTSLRDIPVMFRELGAFGAVMNISTIISIALFIITSKKKYLYFAVFFSFAVMMTILKKTMISNAIVWVFYFIYLANSKAKIKLLFLSLIILVFGNFFIGKELNSNIEESSDYLEKFGPEEHVRLGMYLACFNISTDYFPFGSGMGTFASLSSIAGQYSKIYYDYGVAYIGMNNPEDVANGKHTLLDTYWPHIFGELGLFGTILFLFLWFFPLKRAMFNFKTTEDPFIKGVSFYIVLMVITMTWEGFTLYTPEVPGFVLLHSGLVGLCYYHLKAKEDEIDIDSEDLLALNTTEYNSL